ncbi:MAG: prenyltransferase [Bacteroidota bacterium]
MNGFQKFVMASRVYSLPASVFPTILGIVLFAFIHNQMPDWLLTALSVVGVISIHISCNLINDIYDYKTGIDTPSEENQFEGGGSKVLAKELVSMKTMIRWAWVTGLVAIALAVPIVLMSSPWILVPVAYGLLATVYYTAQPIAFKYMALGDVIVITSMGMLTTIGAYMVMYFHLTPTADFAWEVIFYAVPIGMLVGSLLHLNNIKDTIVDSKYGIKTLPILFGKTFSKVLYVLYTVIPFLIAYVLVAKNMTGELNWLLLVPAVLMLLPLGSAIKLNKKVFANNLGDKDLETNGQLIALFGLIYTLIFVFAAI